MITTSTDLFIKVLEAYKLKTCILLKDGSNLEETDGRFRFQLYEDYSYEDIPFFIKQHLQPNKIVRVADSFHMYTYLLWLPESCIKKFQTNIMTIGPFLEAQPDLETIEKMMNRMKIPIDLLNDVRTHYASLPVIADLLTFEHFLSSLLKNFFRHNYQFFYFPDEDEVNIENSKTYHKIRKQARFAMQNLEEQYKLENLMLNAVTAGDYSAAKSYYALFISFHIQPRTDNLLKNSKNFKIILNTLLRKAAEAGYVHPLYIDDISTKFAILINEAKSLRELTHLSDEMLRKYCILVQNHSLKSFSPAIQTIITYIDFHCEEDLNLRFFADMCHLSKAYLSSLFKKETNSTLTDYIHTVRMRKALTLLNGTSLSIQSIATICGYPDLNYFIRIFKRRYEISPKQYQKKIGKED